MENKFLTSFREAIPKKFELVMLYKYIGYYEQIECQNILKHSDSKKLKKLFLYSGKSITDMYFELFCKECGGIISFPVEGGNNFYWEPVPI